MIKNLFKLISKFIINIVLFLYLIYFFFFQDGYIERAFVIACISIMVSAVVYVYYQYKNNK